MGDLTVYPANPVGFLEPLEDDVPYLIEFPNSTDPRDGAMYEVIVHSRGFWHSTGDVNYDPPGPTKVGDARYKVVGKFDIRSLVTATAAKAVAIAPANPGATDTPPFSCATGAT